MIRLSPPEGNKSAVGNRGFQCQDLDFESRPFRILEPSSRLLAKSLVTQSVPLETPKMR